MWFQKFRFGEEKKEEFRVSMPMLTLTRADFEYSVCPSAFKNFSYTFDVNLHGTSEDRVQQSRVGVEKLVESLDRAYSSDRGFKREQKGSLSSNSREVKIIYYAPLKGFFSREVADIRFNADYTGETISRSYVLLFLNADNQDDLLFAHDILVDLPGVVRSRSAIDTIYKIEQIRNGSGPKIQNFLLD